MRSRSGGIRLGVLGGTFDPIHCGHLEAATVARDALDLAQVLIVPSHVPPHRSVLPRASAFHRFAMVSLAVSGIEGLVAGDEELRAAGPSYTADTLDRLRASGWSSSQIFFITGADAFVEIATWHRYPEVLDLAHFVVISRVGHRLEDVSRRLPDFRNRIRTADHIEDDGDPSILLLNAATPDISSTAVRDLVSRGASIRGLVPPLVETHIHQHRLYKA